MPVDLTGVRAVYFDLDDTLCAYWSACQIALEETFETLRDRGLEPRRLINHWALAFRQFMPELKTGGWYNEYLVTGDKTRTETMRRALVHAGIEEPALAEKLGHHYREARNRHLVLFPDALEVLQRLKSRFPLGLITNGPADIQRMEIAKLDVESYFANVFIEGEIGVGKPDQEVFRRAAEAVGFPAQAILFVGNSYHHDIRPAIEAGFVTAWIRRPTDVPPSADGADPQPEERPADAPPPTLEIYDLKSLLAPLGL